MNTILDTVIHRAHLLLSRPIFCLPEDKGPQLENTSLLSARLVQKELSSQNKNKELFFTPNLDLFQLFPHHGDILDI